VSGISINLDDSHFFYSRTAGEMTEAGVDTCLDPYSNTAVCEFMFCVNAQCASFASREWTPLWEGDDPAAGDDQPCLAGPAPRHRAGLRVVVHNLYLLAQRGIDSYERWLRRQQAHEEAAGFALSIEGGHRVRYIDA
jgi:hypothetical protein